jgi:prepilin-type N-terminal cleavage/methylation domain-containing protein
MTRRHGFTLIELLVVIAIIGILAAMLFPVFARARESARKIQCLSNVKNIAMAVQMYIADYQQSPPVSTTRLPDY